MAATSSAPEIVLVSDSARAAATAGLLMCTIDSLCVSSYSSAWAHDPFANAAVVTPTRSPPPKMRQGPGGDIAADAARVARPNGVSAPASARPTTSRMRSFVASTTSCGRSAKVTRRVHAASVSESGSGAVIPASRTA